MSKMLIDKTKKRHALAAMEELGLDSKLVLVVLKDALKNRDWGSIEADNFTVLANLVIERQLAEKHEKLYEGATTHGQYEQRSDSCFEHEPTCSSKRADKQMFEAATSSMFKRPKVGDLKISETSCFPDVSYALDSSSSKYSKSSYLDDPTRLSEDVPFNVTRNSRAYNSGVQYTQERNTVQVPSEIDRVLDHKEIHNCTFLCKSEEKLSSGGKNLSRADKLQEEALAGWNLKRDEENYRLQHESRQNECPSCSASADCNLGLRAGPCDSANDTSLTSGEENPQALNLLMKNYSSSGDSSESAGHVDTDRILTSKPLSIITATEVATQEKEIYLATELKELDLRTKNQCNDFCQSCDEQKDSCATDSNNFNFTSADSILDKTECGNLIDGTIVPKLPTQSVKKEHDILDVLIAPSTSRNKQQGKNFCESFDEQKANCATESNDFSLTSGSVMDKAECGNFTDGTAVPDLPTQNVANDNDALNVLITCSNVVDPDVDSTPRCNSFDISRGEESIPIPLAKDVIRKLSSTFHYASKSHIYQNASLKFSLAKIRRYECCSCFGDCLNSPMPCACSKETGGDYAYDADGFLCDWFLRKVIKEKTSLEGELRQYCPSASACPFGRLKNVKKCELCRGHLLRSFVKECWTKCGCDKKCGNRVVQRGISCRLEVFWDLHGKGWGVRTLENIPAGAFVCEYAGEIITMDELEEREMSRSGYLMYSFPLLLDADLGSELLLKDGEPLALDNTNYGNIARFINHRCHDANLVDVPVLIENFDRHYYHVAYFTIRPVKALEELTWDYQIDFNDKNSPEAFKCLCESRFCRGRDYKCKEFLQKPS